MRSLIRLFAVVAALTLVLVVPAAADAKRTVAAAGPPADYTQTRNLTQPRYETLREVIRVPAFDGEDLYLEVVRPQGRGPLPGHPRVEPVPRHPG